MRAAEFKTSFYRKLAEQVPTKTQDDTEVELGCYSYRYGKHSVHFAVKLMALSRTVFSFLW